MMYPAMTEFQRAAFDRWRADEFVSVDLAAISAAGGRAQDFFLVGRSPSSCQFTLSRGRTKRNEAMFGPLVVTGNPRKIVGREEGPNY